MKIYISGKISGLDRREAKRNFSTVENMLKIHYPDAKIVNPIKSLVPRWFPWGIHMIFDAMLLKRCTHIYMMSNWKESYGAKIEWELAGKYGVNTIPKIG